MNSPYPSGMPATAMGFDSALLSENIKRNQSYEAATLNTDLTICMLDYVR